MINIYPIKTEDDYNNALLRMDSISPIENLMGVAKLC